MRGKSILAGGITTAPPTSKHLQEMKNFSDAYEHRIKDIAFERDCCLSGMSCDRVIRTTSQLLSYYRVGKSTSRNIVTASYVVVGACNGDRFLQ